MRRLWTLMAVTIMLAACGPAGSVVDVGSAPTRADAESPSRGPDTREVQPSVADAPASASPGAAGESSSTGTEDLPGEPVDWPHTSGSAAEVGVLGVESGDVLNVRARPGADQPIVDRLEPLRRGLAFTGAARSVDGVVWPEITVDGTTGWVNGRYVGWVAGTDDITAAIVGGGEAPTAATMRDLAELVVVAHGLADGYRMTWGPIRDPNVAAEAQRRIVISDGPRTGDLGEITLDVIDMFDDAVAAERLVIFAQPLASSDGFTLKAVERTFFCARGGSDLCV